MKITHLTLLVATGALLIYASSGLPDRGVASIPPHWEESPVGSVGAQAYYIRNAMKDARTPNMVTAVLGDYRSYDTLGETVVIFTAGIICALLLRRVRHERNK